MTTWTTARYNDPPFLDPDPIDFGNGPVEFPTERKTITDYFPPGVDDGKLPTDRWLAYHLAGAIPVSMLKDWLLFGANEYRIEIDLQIPDPKLWGPHVIGVWNRLTILHNIFLEAYLPRDSIRKDVFEEYERHAMILRGTWEGSQQQRSFQNSQAERERAQKLMAGKQLVETPNYLAYKKAVQEAVAKGLPPPPLPPVSHFNDDKPKSATGKYVLSPEQRARKSKAQREERERLRKGFQ